MIRFSLADAPMRLDELRDLLAAAEEAEDAAVIALASYGSQGGGHPREFDALLKAVRKARVVTAAAYAAWKSAEDRSFAVRAGDFAGAPSVWTTVHPDARGREIVATPLGETRAVVFASVGIATANDSES